MVVDDRVLEEEESFGLFLSLPEPLNNILFVQQNADVHITDNDGEILQCACTYAFVRYTCD